MNIVITAKLVLTKRVVIKEKAALAALLGANFACSLSRSFHSAVRVFLLEFLHSSGCVNNLLLSGIKRVAERTHLNRDIFSNC